MITQFQRRRNQKPGVPFQNLNYRIQVNGNTRTFKAKKTVSPSTGTPSLDFSSAGNSMYIPIFPL